MKGPITHGWAVWAPEIVAAPSASAAATRTNRKFLMPNTVNRLAGDWPGVDLAEQETEEREIQQADLLEGVRWLKN